VNESLHIPPSKTDVGLRQWLGYGALGALAAGMLGVASSAVSLAGWQVAGLDPSEVLDLAALLVLAVVLVAYWKLSLKTEAPGLRKSALGLFGIQVIVELASLNTTEGDRHWWNVVIGVVLALATVVLLIVVWTLEEIEQGGQGETATSTPGEKTPAEAVASAPTPAATANTAQQDAPPAGGKPAKSVGPVLGGVAVAALFLLKILLRAGAKLAAKKGVPLMSMDLIGVLLFVALLLLVVVFLVWFAVVKIRLRKKLGAFATLVGSVELLMILLGGLALAGLLWDAFQVLSQADLDEKAMDVGFEAVVATWTRRVAVGAIVVSALWALLTAGLFVDCRSRLTAVSR
jgi:hypothetical protein